jgi:2-polyprenyl-6-hydroxyphenyl methylase/3-demethylubiquinone-9 3-methyltransferase
MAMSLPREVENPTPDSDEPPTQDPVAKPISFHDHIAEEWDRKYAKESFRSRQAAFEECLPSKRLFGNWLDAGCGTGYLSRWIAEKGAYVESVDLAPKMLELFVHHRDKYDAKDRLKEPKIADINFLPFPANAFDGILCSSVLEYVDNPAVALKEFRRVLSPGGWLAISVPNRISLLRAGLVASHRVTRLFGKPWPAYLEYSIHGYTVSEFRNLLRSAGFESKCFAGCGTSLPGLKNTNLGWSLLVFGAIRKA